MKLLFICNQNKYRSKTAEELFKEGFETKSAGLYGGQPVTSEVLDWADVVVVMEEGQRAEVGRRFPKQYMMKKIVSLNVPDLYKYYQPELVELLKERVLALI